METLVLIYTILVIHDITTRWKKTKEAAIGHSFVEFQIVISFQPRIIKG